MAENNKDKNQEKKDNKFLNLLKKSIVSIKRLRYKINKKIIIISLSIILVTLLGIVFVPMIFKADDKTTEEQKTKNLEIIIPDGAYNGNKNFIIKEIPMDSIEYQNLTSMANFQGEIYSIEPNDGVEESSLLPMKIRYKIPDDLYFGDNFINFSIAYASNGEPPLVSELSGSKIIELNNSHYVEAETFHFSKIGLIVKPPKESDYGMKTLTEKPATYRPDIILIPGTDVNFTGYLSNTNTSENPYGNNFWSVLFKERTIWQYKYPLVNTRSKTYYDSFQGFLMRTGSKSYIEFEAKRFAQELKRHPNREFDIIAHGIGGLIARYAIESDETINNVKNIVLLSTPNYGTNLANPLFFNLIYGKDTKVLMEVLKIDEESSFNIKYNSNFYLEQINSYYYDLIPNSDFLNKLNSFGMRKDVNYITIAGKNSGIKMDLTKSPLSRLYPEFINGEGDGVVSVDSALIPEASTKLLYDYKFYDLYSKPDVLENIKKILEDNLDVPKIEEFKDDEFIETYEQLYSKDNKESSTNKNTAVVNIENKKFNLPINYSEVSLVKNIEVIKEINYNNPILHTFDSKVLISTDNGIYDIEGNILLKADIINCYENNNRFMAVSRDGIFIMDKNSKEFIKIEEESIQSDEAYYLPNLGLIRVSHSLNNSTVYLNKEIISTNSKIMEIEESNEINYFIFQNRISTLNNDILNDFITKEDIKNKTGYDFDYIKDVKIIDNDFFIISNDYKLIYVKGDKSFYQVVGNGDVGKLGLVNVKDNLYVFGSDTITYLDIKNKNFPGQYQRFDYINLNYTINGNTVYGIRQNLRGFELWKGNLINF